MYAAVSRFDEAAVPLAPAASPAPRLERAEGAVHLAFLSAAGRTQVAEAYQRGSARVRFPRIYDSADPEAVLLNTAGGVTGGDRFSVAARMEPGTAAVLTTQAAEKAYRSPGDAARIDVALDIGAGARLAWLPQETILFDGGRLSRTLSVDVGEGGEALLCEAVVLGRTASGETVRAGCLADRWRVRRCGRLAYADDLRFDGDVAAASAGAATLAGNRAFASLLLVSPDAGIRIDAARGMLDDSGIAAGASAWDGMLAARLVAADGAGLRRALAGLVAAIGKRLPRAWSL